MNIPANLHEMYATLTAKRPELGVGLDFASCTGWTRTYCENVYANIHDDEAAALIRCKWEDALPHPTFLFQNNSSFGIRDAFDHHGPFDWRPDPLTALYHFHMAVV